MNSDLLSKLEEQFSNPAMISRRLMLKNSTSGFGLLALASLFANETRGASSAGEAAMNPLALKSPQHPAKAKHVIFLFMPGGPSHVDLFDPKPKLAQYDGKPITFEKPKLMHSPTGNLLQSPFKFKKYGQAGTDVSE